MTKPPQDQEAFASHNKPTRLPLPHKGEKRAKVQNIQVLCLLLQEGSWSLHMPRQKGQKTTSKPEWVHSTTCHRCGKLGHLAFDCPPKYPVVTAKVSIANSSAPKMPTLPKKAPSSLTDESTLSMQPAQFAGSAEVHFDHIVQVCAQHNHNNALPKLIMTILASYTLFHSPVPY